MMTKNKTNWPPKEMLDGTMKWREGRKSGRLPAGTHLFLHGEDGGDNGSLCRYHLDVRGQQLAVSVIQPGGYVEICCANLHLSSDVDLKTTIFPGSCRTIVHTSQEQDISARLIYMGWGSHCLHAKTGTQKRTILIWYEKTGYTFREKDQIIARFLPPEPEFEDGWLLELTEAMEAELAVLLANFPLLQLSW